MAEKVAGAAVAGSVGLAGAAWIAEAEPYLTAGAALVAILAGLAATWYHIERAKYMHRKNIQAQNKPWVPQGDKKNDD